MTTKKGGKNIETKNACRLSLLRGKRGVKGGPIAGGLKRETPRGSWGKLRKGACSNRGGTKRIFLRPTLRAKGTYNSSSLTKENQGGLK